MSITLDPIVSGKLRHFARRRLWLIVARGLCAGVVTFLLCMAIVAAIDWYWLLSDNVRWSLSGAVYMAVVVAVWVTCLRRMLHLPAKEEIASQVEQTEPLLRENLLSAVELATDDPSSLHDSPVFRSLLQGKVAEQMGRIRVSSLLPVRLVAKWILTAIVVVAVTLLLLTSGDARFRQLAARAMLPGANIARVSRVNVEILQPTPHSLMLAEDETIAIVVEVTGGNFDEVTLETVTEKQGEVRQSMKGRTDSEFAANIHVMDETVEYRIMAGDAVTQRFRIEARPRPRVTAFRKTWEYPAYALLPAETVTETHGDLLVLEGTQASLVLELDQQVAAAALRIDPSDSEEMIVIPLTPVSDSQNGLQWKATVPVDKAAIYKVHLVSRETGFENLFSPKYEIRPQPDLIPRAGFVDQQESTLLLPPNDILALKAMAEDDLPLVSLAQHVSVNGRDWVALPLDAKPADDTDGRHLTAAWQWDLLNHKLKTGDQVMTKLVATDRKGNTGESIPLRIIVAAADFDPQRHTIMQRKLGLYDELDVLKQTFERTADDAKNVAEHYQSLMAYNFMSSVAGDLDALLRQQRFVVDSPTQSWDRLQRQETVAVNLLKDIERLLRDQRRRMPNYLEGHINNLLTWAQSQRERMQDSMESEEKLEQLRNVSKDFLTQLNNQQRFDVADGGLPGRIVNAWRDLDNRSGSLYLVLEQIGRAAQQENQLTAQAGKAPDSAEGKKLLDQAERFVAEVDLKLHRSVDQLRTRRELTQTRKDADAQYASDAGLTHRAATSLLNQHRELPPQDSMIPANLLEIAPAYRTLEAGHDLMIAHDALESLLNMERWDSQGLQAHMDHPRQWDLVQRGFELGSQRLREAGVKNELVGPLDQIRWGAPVRDAGRKISERRWKRDAMIGAGHELVLIRDELAKVIDDLQPIMADARAVIAKVSPTIPQMAQQTAEQIREMEEATTATADTVEKKDDAAEPESAEAAQLLADLEQQQDTVNQQIADLTEALVEDANAQDVLEASQRERARDADDSIAMIQEPATQMNRAMEKAQESASGEQQAKDLAQAAEQQEKTAQALELVAEHFDKLEEGLDVAETRAELRQAERDLGIARQMDQQYENSRQLADQANKDAQELMSELEAELQQKLNEAAAKANTAREEQLLPELAQTAQEAKAALAEATETLKQAKQQSDVGKDAQIHADDKAREAQKKDSENRHKQFHEQQKRTASDLAKRAEDSRKRADQAVQSAEKVVKAADTRVQQAKDRSNAKPDDAGLKRNVAQEEIRQAAEQKKLTSANDVLQKSEQKAQQERKRADDIKNQPLPPLDAPNPATQLASQYAEEAVKAADELNQKAEQLAAAADFGNELAPPKNQLASAEQQQHEVTQDVGNSASSWSTAMKLRSGASFAANPLKI